MNYELRTLRGLARMADLCSEKRKSPTSGMRSLPMLSMKMTRSKSVKLFFIPIFLTFFYLSGFSQQWEGIGPDDFNVHTLGSSSYNTTASDANGNLYVAFKDGLNSNKATVKKYDGSSWVTVGNPGISSSEARDLSMAVDSNNVPYVAFQEYGGSKKATVMKFDGNNWVAVGVPEFTSGQVSSLNLVMDNNDVPHLAYRSNSSYKATVEKFDGANWVTVGNSEFTTSTSYFPSLAFDTNNVPYLAYIYRVWGGGNTRHLELRQFDGTNWVMLTSLSIHSSSFSNLSMAIDSTNTPYAAYGYSSGAFYYTSVRKYNGSSWVGTSGNSGAASGSSGSTHIKIAGSNSGTVYTAYRTGTDKKAVVRKLDGSTWVNLGSSSGISGGSASILSLSVGPNNIPYVGYSDGAVIFRKYDGSDWVTLGGGDGIANDGGSNISIAIDNNNVPYIAYVNYVTNGFYDATVKKYDGTKWVEIGGHYPCSKAELATDSNNDLYMIFRDDSKYYWNYSNGKASAKKYNGSTWTDIGPDGFTPSSIYDHSIAIDNNDVPYLAYRNSNVRVMKYTGSWVDAGNTSFSIGDARYVSIAIDNNNVPYVAYHDDGDSSRATVMKLDTISNTWVVVGTTGFSAGQADYTSIAIDNNNVPYIVYQDDADSSKATVKKFDGTNWVNVGPSGFSPSTATYTRIVIDNNNIPYVAYKDGANEDKLTVVKFDGTNWVNVGAGSVSREEVRENAMTLDANGSPAIAYHNDNHISYAKTFNPNPPATPPFDADLTASTICPDATEWLVPITVGAVPADIGAVSLVLDYDTTKLTYNAVHSAHANMLNAALDNSQNLQVSDNNGKITISWANATAATISNDTLMTLKFVPAGGASDFSAMAGQTTDFTWDETVSGNCEFADDMANVMATTFNAQTGAAVNAAPTAGLTSDATNNTTLCAGDNVTFTATGGTSYAFDVNGGTPVAGTGTNGDEFSSATLANGDVVTVTVTDANGCSSTASLTTVVNALPTAGLTSDAASNTTLCAGDNVTFTATGGTSYAFDVDGGTPVAGAGTNGNEFSSAALVNGNVVTVTVTDANGCSSTASLTMVVNPLPTVTLTSDDADNTICAGETVTFTGSGATSYSFDVNGGTPVAGAGTNGDEFSSATLANGDIVTVTGTDANGCSNTASITMVVNPLPTAGLTSDATNDTTLCAGDNVTFTATGGTSYSFDVNGGTAVAGSGTNGDEFSSATLANGDVVTVTVTNANGCSSTASLTMVVNAVPTSTLASDDADSRVCQGQAVTFTAASTDGADEFIFISSIDGTVQAQSATATYTDNALQDGEVISVIGVNSTTGCQQAAATTFTFDVDGCHSVSGNLVYKNTPETPMGNVVITIAGPGLTANTTVTTDVTDGSFSVANLFDNETYTFSYATTKTHGGNNSTDALLALLDGVGILNQTGLNAKAGDVNIDNNVNSADALGIQLRFVFANVDTFPSGQDWVFEAGTFTPTGDITGQKLHALAMGDINGSYVPNSAENKLPTVNIVNDGQLAANDGDRVLIPVCIKQAEDVGAMSLAMFFPSNAMTIHDVTLADGTTMLHNTNGDELRVAWANTNSQIFATDDVLYFVDATIHDVAAYNTAPFSLTAESELANGTGAVLTQVVLGVPTVQAMVTSTNAIEAAAASVRSFPNPFSDRMTIEYDLPATSNVTIQMFNSLGQEIATLVNDSQTQGTHRAIWNADNQAAGVYFYTITVTEANNSYKETRQVVLVK